MGQRALRELQKAYVDRWLADCEDDKALEALSDRVEPEPWIVEQLDRRIAWVTAEMRDLQRLFKANGSQLDWENF